MDSVVGRDGIDVLSDVERLSFADYVLGLDVDGAAGSVQALQGGIRSCAGLYWPWFWVNAMDRGGDARVCCQWLYCQ